MRVAPLCFTEQMQDRIDSLIADRAGWFFRDDALTQAARGGLRRLLRYEDTLDLASRLEPLPPSDALRAVATLIARRITVTGLEHLPKSGPALVVANHPTGIADGVALYHALAERRPDLYFFANADILRVLPRLAPVIAPVEWRPGRRSHTKTRATMTFTRDAVAAGRLGVIFPSGRLAQRRGLRLHERPWLPSAASIARRYEMPVIPLHIQARNSALFYLFDVLHPTLRDITLFHETLNKASQPFRLQVGPPIPPAAQALRSEEAIQQLKDAVFALDRRRDPRPLSSIARFAGNTVAPRPQRAEP